MQHDIDEAMLDRIKYEQTLTAYVSELQSRSREDKLEEFAKFRDFKFETVKKLGIFYIGEMAEMLLPNYIDEIQHLGVISETNYKPIFRNRWVMPIKNEKGLVRNLVGYSPDADERYIYGTSRYYRRRETLYGLENINMAYDMGYAILTEGITDTIRLRDMGYENSFAMCGTWKSDTNIRMLNRCKYGVIRIPDRDDAGRRALKSWNYKRHVTVMINLQYKDVDEMCKNCEENKEWLNAYLSDCINWIKTVEHNGQNCLSEEITVL